MRVLAETHTRGCASVCSTRACGHMCAFNVFCACAHIYTHVCVCALRSGESSSQFTPEKRPPREAGLGRDPETAPVPTCFGMLLNSREHFFIFFF